MKPGTKTTEFWIVLSVIVLAVLGAVFNEIPTLWAANIASILAIVYAVARTLLKFMGDGADVDMAEQLRATIREEMRFVLTDKKRAEEIK